MDPSTVMVILIRTRFSLQDGGIKNQETKKPEIWVRAE